MTMTRWNPPTQKTDLIKNGEEKNVIAMATEKVTSSTPEFNLSFLSPDSSPNDDSDRYIELDGEIGCEAPDSSTLDIDCDEISAGNDCSLIIDESCSNEAVAACSMSVQHFDSADPVITLPTPLSLQNRAYGGNQSYLNYKDTLSRFPAGANSPTPNYWDSNDTSAIANTINKVAGDIGLHNIGNTCFMNSGLQCLIHTPNLVEYFLDNAKSIFSVLNNGNSLVHQFQSIILLAWLSNDTSISLHDFKNVLGSIYAQFRDCRQHDCQEFLALMLDSLHEQLKRHRLTLKDDLEDQVHSTQNENQSKISDLGSRSALHFSNINGQPEPEVSETVSVKRIFTCEDREKATNENEREMKSLSNVKKPLFSFDKYFSSFKKNNLQKRRASWNKLKEHFIDCGVMMGNKARRKSSTKASETPAKRVKLHNSSNPPPKCKESVLNTSRPVCEQFILKENDQACCVEACEQDSDDSSGVSNISNSDMGTPEAKLLAETDIKNNLSSKGDDYWSKHMAANNTVIASTFQGMYKSTVKCSVCKYVSLTYEPFMYLSLPIPRITDREHTIRFVSAKDRRTAKLDLKLNISETIYNLKEKFLKAVFDFQYTEEMSNQFIAAEVGNYIIFKVLNDNVEVKTINENSRNIYIFELNDNFNEKYGCEAETTVFSDAGAPDINVSCKSSASSAVKEDSDMVKPLLCQVYLEENWDIPDSEQGLSGGSDPKVKSDASVTSSDITSESNQDIFNASQRNGKVAATLENATGKPGKPYLCNSLLRCCICLEDFPRSELKYHDSCKSCTSCSSCLTTMATHFETEQKDRNGERRTLVKCAVCCQVADYETSFLSVATSEDLTAPLKMFILPLLFKSGPSPDNNNNSSSCSRLLGTPLLLKIPSSLPSSEFHQFIAQVNPFPESEYRVLIVSWNGKDCGICGFGSSCSGCEFSKDGTIHLNTGACIMISYIDLSPEQMASIEPSDMPVQQSPSFSPWSWSNRRDEPSVSIHECLESFSEMEHLDEQNPWFCPRCCKNQCATKELSICRFPDFLIIYLKRFVYLDHHSNKLNNKLKFPVTDLNVSGYVADEFSGSEHIYDLYSCVCHYGTASSGHYTAYAKNPVNQVWSYFNDDHITPSRPPSDREHSSAYILFYERKGLRNKLSNTLSRLQNSHSFNDYLPTQTVSAGRDDREDGYYDTVIGPDLPERSNNVVSSSSGSRQDDDFNDADELLTSCFPHPSSVLEIQAFEALHCNELLETHNNDVHEKCQQTSKDSKAGCQTFSNIDAKKNADDDMRKMHGLYGPHCKDNSLSRYKKTKVVSTEEIDD